MANCSVKFHLGARECEYSSERLTPLTEDSPIVILKDQASLLIDEFKKTYCIDENIIPTDIELYYEKKCIYSWRELD